LRVPLLNRKELTLLARVGALNKLDGIEHRRDALWQVERAGKLEGPLLRQNSDWLREVSDALPLQKMNTKERLVWVSIPQPQATDFRRLHGIHLQIALFAFWKMGSPNATCRP
jgi:hypothetical protein